MYFELNRHPAQVPRTKIEFWGGLINDLEHCAMMRHESKQLLSYKKKFYCVLSIGCFSALPDCSYTSARQDVTVVAMDDILFSRSSNDCKRFCDDARYNFRSILYIFFKNYKKTYLFQSF